MFKTLQGFFLFALFFQLHSFATYKVDYNDAEGIYHENGQNRQYVVRESTDAQQLYHKTSLYDMNKWVSNNAKIYLTAGLGAHYIYTPNLSYIESGVQKEILEESYTHTIIPLGFEFAFPSQTTHTFSIGANYYLNPFNAKSSKSGVTVFTAKTHYMLYGKVNMVNQKSLSPYFIAGVTSFDISVFNDLTNTEFGFRKTLSPSIGIGLNWKTANERISMFVDGIYSYVSKDIDYTGNDARLKEISQKNYHSMKLRIGFRYNIASM